MEKKKKRVFVLGFVALLSVISIGMICCAGIFNQKIRVRRQ